MPNTSQAYLDYYKKFNISPVAQDVSDLKKHFQRRDALYRQCGIPAGLIEGKKVLEIGPGTGHNALYTNSLEPELYTLVDGNQKSCLETAQTLNGHFENQENINIIHSNFWDFTTDNEYDLVCCEGAIPWQNDPQEFLFKLSQFVKPGGILLITCSDAVSFLSEILRRLAARLILSNGKKPDDFTRVSCLPVEDVLDELRPFFIKQLRHLPSMSRSVDDWIHDNILQPIIGQPLSATDAIKTLRNTFDVYGSSPQILTDWRWYKDIQGEGRNYNERAANSFKAHVHNMLDYRHLSIEQPKKVGEEINQLATQIMLDIFSLDNKTTQNYPELLKNVTNQVTVNLAMLHDITSLFSPSTSESIVSLQQAFTEWSKHGYFEQDLPGFSPWFGRGQQYLSFVKKPLFEK